MLEFLKKIRNGRIVFKLGRLFVVFGAFKAFAFFVPFIYAHYLSLSSYGHLEYILSWSRNLSALLSMGLAAGVPYFILTRKRIWYSRVFAFHVFFIAAIVLVVELIFLSLGFTGLEFVLIPVFTSLMVSQAFRSAFAKIDKHIALASALDTGVFILLGVYFAGSLVFSYVLDLKALIYLSVIYQALLLISFWPKLDFKRLFFKYRSVINYGFYTGISWWYMSYITAGGRILVGAYLPKGDVGIYSFYLRLVMIIIVVQQFFTVLFYKEFYLSSFETLDSYYEKFFLIFFPVMLMIVYFSPLLLAPYFSVVKLTISHYDNLFLSLGCMIFLWIAVSWQEVFINRLDIAGRFLMRMFPVAFLGGVIVFFVGRLFKYNLFDLLAIQIFFMYATFIVQFILLKRSGFFLRKMFCYASLAFLLAIVVDFL